MSKHAGRPSKLTPEIKERIAQYISDCLENEKVPSIARLAVILDITKKTLYNWSENDEELLHTFSQLQSLQEATLIDGSLTNKLNASIAKLMLANHGYKERQDVTSDDKAVQPLLVRFVGDEDQAK